MYAKLITMTNQPSHPGLKQLVRSLDHFRWNYEVIADKYEAFGSKQVCFYNYMKKNPKYDHFFILDGHDTFVLDSMDTALDIIEEYNYDKGILFNAEKACWPYSEWESRYPEVATPWKYLNGGAAFVNRQKYIKLFEENPISHRDNDQVNFASIYLDPLKREQYKFNLDTDCAIFQSVAFEHDDDFNYYPNRIVNKKTGTFPIIIHGNGKTDMSKIYKLI